MRRWYLCISLWFVGTLTLFSGQELEFNDVLNRRIHATKANYESRLSYRGKYSSIFGIVPREYTLEGDDIKKMVIDYELPKNLITIDVQKGKSKQILHVPEEIPQVEEHAFALEGKRVILEKTVEKGWIAKSAGEGNTPELIRLARRFSPESNPFLGCKFTIGEPQKINLNKLLEQLGYIEIQTVEGNATATLVKAEEDKLHQLDISLDADFDAGHDIQRRTIELRLRGNLKLEGQAMAKGIHSTFTLTGKMNIHGTRELPDGRKVPYSLISDMEYTYQHQLSD